jgi:lipopolysaccharide biosynthesis glycosyltransferase
MADAQRERVITVVSTVDDGFLPYAGVVATSMAHWADANSRIEYVVFVHGPIGADATKLDGLKIGPVRIVVREAPTPLEQFGSRFGFTSAALTRLILGEVMPGHDRVCYLDADLLINADIAALFYTELGPTKAAAVADYRLATCAYRERPMKDGGPAQGFADYFTTVIGFPRADWGTYFNTGVMVLDLDAFRRAGIAEKAVATLQKSNDILQYRDQDVLNILLQGQVKLLPPSWNVSAIILRDRDVSGLPDALAAQIRQEHRQQHIIHYAGPLKPWLRTGMLPAAGDWWHFAQLSPTWPTIERRYHEMLRQRGAIRNPLVGIATTLANWKYALGPS